MDAAPNYNTPEPTNNEPGANPFFDPKNLDPQMMAQISEAMQRLPRGQLQKLQSLVQRAMAGKDVSREADEFERALPPGVRDMLMSAKNTIELTEKANELNPSDAKMTEDQARAIVEAAAAKGEIDAEQAKQLLEGTADTTKPKGFGNFWKGFRGKK
jgi:hypothetical protein